MNKLLRFVFYQLFIRPAIYILLGLNIRHRQRLPQTGPAIIVANHNSHLDTMLLMSLLPWHLQKKTRPVAAADYFLKNRLLAWFSRSIIGIIPIQRSRSSMRKNPFAEIQTALEQDEIIIFFPEGSRGEPEKMNEIKKGIAHLASDNQTIPIHPIFIYGLGKSLPKNEALLVPFVIDVVIGEPLYGQSDKDILPGRIKESFEHLHDEIPLREWE